MGFVSLGAGTQNKQYDEWNKAKREFSDLIQSLTTIAPILLGVGTPSRHSSYIFGRPQEVITGRLSNDFGSYPPLPDSDRAGDRRDGY